MSNRDQHIVQSLRRWIQGDMDREAESRLDRQAREEPFLEEALEGYRQFPESKHQERLNRMRKQLTGKTQDRKRGAVLFSLPYQIAAAATVVLAVGLFWWLNPTGSRTLAEAQQQESQVSDQMETPGPVLEEQTDRKEEAIGLDPAGARDREAEDRSVAAQPLAADGAAGEAAPPRSEQSSSTESRATSTFSAALPKAPNNQALTPEAAPAQRGIVDSNIAPPPPLPPSSAVKRRINDLPIGEVQLPAPLSGRLVTGKVVDPSGAPLYGVRVATPGAQTGTITNQNGQYEILLDSTARKLAFQRSGYAVEEVDISESAGFVPVTLQETGLVLDAVTAERMTKGSPAEKVNPGVEGFANTLDLAEPVIGFRRFNRYLRQGLRYPQAAIQQGISGQVTLGFTVLADGSITDVRVLETLDTALEEEAKRLLVNGPKWKITAKDSAKVTLSYRFDFSL